LGDTSVSSEGTAVSQNPDLPGGAVSLEERLRRERQRLHSSGVTQFSWVCCDTIDKQDNTDSVYRILVPIRGNLHIQEGVGVGSEQPQVHQPAPPQCAQPLRLVYDKHHSMRFCRPPLPRGVDSSAVDPQLSPDGSMIAFCVGGEIYVMTATPLEDLQEPVRITFGAVTTNDDLHSNARITHGLADFLAQEEMDRYRGFWWHPSSRGILFCRVDETNVPPYRITHQGKDFSTSTNSNYIDSSEATYEDHRYPFAGKDNPKVQLGFVKVDPDSILTERPIRSPQDDNDSDSTVAGFQPPLHLSSQRPTPELYRRDTPFCDSIVIDESRSRMDVLSADEIARENWSNVLWFDPPKEASEYLARVTWLPDGCACAQWQNRAQTSLVLTRLDLAAGKSRTLLSERSDIWINLHHMTEVLDRPIHPLECDYVEERNFSELPNPLPEGSCSFLFASERTGFSHLYLYTFVPGFNRDQAILLRALSAGEWVVESIVGMDIEKDVVYVTGTYDSVLERHLYALPLTNNPRSATDDSQHQSALLHPPTPEDAGMDSHNNGVRRGLKHVIGALSGAAIKSKRNTTASPFAVGISEAEQNWRIPLPIRLTVESGMHNIVMDDDCRIFVDTSSDLGRPTTVRIYALPDGGPFASSSQFNGKLQRTSKKQVDTAHHFENRSSEVRFLCTLYDAIQDDKSLQTAAAEGASSAVETSRLSAHLPPPELMTLPTSDGTESLHAALYRPDPRIHGPGPYPLVCAVYGGPHVQRVNRSWSQCADMRAQRLRSLGFCVVKCDNRGSSRRGLAFESAIKKRLGRLEVLDQVATVRHLVLRGIADPNRVGIYGWSYGGYLAAMCLCRAPDVFHVAVAGAPVTSWDGYDTHYTERYMGLPAENSSGYRESAVFDHVPNMRGKLMIVHGLIDENVHFRHTARLINRLIASGKDYDLLIFPDERHSPRRLRDRIYMEQRISDYITKYLGAKLSLSAGNGAAIATSSNASSVRAMAGHL
jgi:dienelactone hydrolase